MENGSGGYQKKGMWGGKAHLDESADDAEGGEAQVLKWTCFRSCVQERVQEEGYMGYVFFFGGVSRGFMGGYEGMEKGTVQEELSCLGMRRDALEEREGVANAVGYMRRQVRWREHWIDGHDLLEEGWHDTWVRGETKGDLRRTIRERKGLADRMRATGRGRGRHTARAFWRARGGRPLSFPGPRGL
jgi:hypothetical protein